MECPRCQGRMVQERFEDMLDTCLNFIGWRCLICGDIMDEVVAMNRQSSLLAARGLKAPLPTESIVS
jgi:hypothetical protein